MTPDMVINRQHDRGGCMKNRIRWVLTASLLIEAVLTAACGNDPETAVPVGPTGAFTIVYTGNIGGLLTACGCRPPLGGVARRAAVLDDIRGAAGKVLVVDSGAMLYDGPDLLPPEDAIKRFSARRVAETITGMGVDIMNVGGYDLANGPDSLLAMDRELPGAWISSNVVMRDSGEEVFPPDTVVTMDGVRVGVFGIMTDRRLGVEVLGPAMPVTATDYAAAAAKAVERLKDRADLVVALAWMDEQDARQMVEKVAGIDIVVFSHTGGHNPGSEVAAFQPFRHNGSLFVSCPDGGRVIGRLDLEIIEGRADFIDRDREYALLPPSIRTRDGLDNRSKYLNTFYLLGPDVKADSTIALRVEDYVTQIERSRKQVLMQ
jgi:2',3'-cyclic-nucleotide 2'-phosphodiesterase (5'-nucleotidase family)